MTIGNSESRPRAVKSQCTSRDGLVVALLVAACLAIGVADGRAQTGITKKKEARFTTERMLQDLDARRLQAMVDVDEAVLDETLADDLSYVHSNGLVQDKSALISSLADGRIDYLSLQPSDVKVRVYGRAAVLTGRVKIKVAVAEKTIDAVLLYTAVYASDENGHWRMVAYHSVREPEPQAEQH